MRFESRECYNFVVTEAFPLEQMRVRFAGATDIGRKRSHNEDSIYLPQKTPITVVADGMGGHASGDVASKIAVEIVSSYFNKTADEQSLTWPYKVEQDQRKEITRMVTSVSWANQEIFEYGLRDAGKKGMGTTCVAAFFVENSIIIGHVGDSRAYLLRNGKILQLTEDHSLINDYIKLKRVTAEEAESWPQKNVIVRALGMKQQVEVDITVERIQPGDLFLICSDGLCGMLTDPQMAAIAYEETDINAASEKLIAAANAEGGHDNISVVLARVEAN